MEILAKLKKKEESLKKSRWVFSVLTILQLSLAVYSFYQYQITIKKVLSCDEEMLRINFLEAHFYIAMYIIFAFSSLFVLWAALDGWIGSPERKALIKLLEEKGKNNEI